MRIFTYVLKNELEKALVRGMLKHSVILTKILNEARYVAIIVQEYYSFQLPCFHCISVMVQESTQCLHQTH